MSSSTLSSQRSDIMAWAMLGVWLVGISVALHLYPMESGQPFQLPGSPLVTPEKQPLEDWFRRVVMVPGAAPMATVIHVFRSGCACNAVAEGQLRALMTRYRSKQVRFVAATLSDTTESSVRGLPLLRGNAAPPAAAMLQTAPAVFIFGADGRLMYYGPYSDSAWCGGTGGLLVDSALDRALVGKESALPIAARGCFCT